jgi:hypothetical protein
MKVTIDNEVVYEVTDTIKKVLEYDMPSSTIHEEVCRRAAWAVDVKKSACWEEICRVWMPILSERYPSLPTDWEELAKVVFSQPDYQDRDAREREMSEQNALNKSEEK